MLRFPRQRDIFHVESGNSLRRCAGVYIFRETIHIYYEIIRIPENRKLGQDDTVHSNAPIYLSGIAIVIVKINSTTLLKDVKFA